MLLLCRIVLIFSFIVTLLILFQEKVYAIRRDIATKQFIKVLGEKSFSFLRHTFSTLRLLKIEGLTMVEKGFFLGQKVSI